MLALVLVAMLTSGSCRAWNEPPVAAGAGLLAPGFAIPTANGPLVYNPRAQAGATSRLPRVGGATQAPAPAPVLAPAATTGPGQERALVGPAVFLVVNRSDSFTDFLLRDSASLDAFLLTAPVPAATFVFLQDEEGQGEAVRAALVSRMDVVLPNATRAQWLQRLVFANATIAAMRASASPGMAVLPAVLDASSHRSMSRTIGVRYPGSPGANAPAPPTVLQRLDGHFQFCNVVDFTNHSPSDPTEAWPSAGLNLTLARQPCGQPAGKPFANQAIVLLNEDMTACTAEEAAIRATAAGATAVVVMAGAEQALRQLGQDAFEDQGMWAGADTSGLCSMVPFDKEVLAALQSNASLSMTFQSYSSPGRLFALSAEGEWRQGGSEINPSLTLMSYLAQELEQAARVEAHLAAPRFVVPVFRGAIGMGHVANLTVPSLEAFDTLELHGRLTCLGDSDLACDKWDHIITVTVHCSTGALGETAGQPGELGRWVTPYARRTGQWVTDATPLLAWFRAPAAQSCSFRLTDVDNGSPWVFSLDLRAGLAAATSAPSGKGSPSHIQELFNNTGHGRFDASYNQRASLQSQAPAGVARAVLVALITGHGDMEFEASSHVFTINGLEVNATFMDPVDQNGCAKRVPQGVLANGHGAWWYGRNGWCNGDAVHPVERDVTQALPAGGGPFKISYRGLQYDAKTQQFEEPSSPGGYILLSSNLVYYL